MVYINHGAFSFRNFLSVPMRILGFLPSDPMIRETSNGNALDFRTLGDQCSCLCAVVDETGRIGYLNPATQLLLGLEAGAWDGLNLFHLLEALNSDWFRQPNGFVAEVRIRARNGEFIPVLLKGTPIGAGYLLTGDNLAQLRGIQKTKDEFALIVNNSPNSILLLATDGVPVFLNLAAKAMLGVAGSGVPPKKVIARRIHTRSLKLLRTIGFPTALREGHWKGEITYLQSGHEFLDLDCHIFPLHEADGSIVRLAIICRDITAERTADKELRIYTSELEYARASEEANARQLALLVDDLSEANNRARSASEAKSNFLASMSHEIRTPMCGVIGMADLLLETKMTSEQQEFAETIRSSGDALLSIINDILDFSKIEAGKMTIDPIEFDLGQAIDQILELLASKAWEKGIRLSLRYAPGTPEKIIGDPGRIRQILLNLIGNAIKFTGQGRVTLNVSVPNKPEDGASVEGPFLEFSVSDTGIGIPASKISKLFNHFTQVDASTTRKYGGTGLGLAICKRLVELMGGQIGLTSEEGRGSTFTVTMPLLVRASLPAASSKLAGVRVALFDDDLEERQILEEQLRSWGAVVDQENAQGPPSFVLYGAMALNKPAANPASGDALRIFLYSGPGSLTPEQLREAGFQGYLHRPCRPRMLRQMMESMVGGKSEEVVTRHSLVALHATTAPVESVTVSSATLGCTVLLVEDNLVNQRLGMRLLEKIGCRVTIANNGLEAIEKWKQTEYDIILMDCQMPEMDGYTATREIRKLEKDLGRTPIIAMTANAMPGDKEKCLEAGMDDFLSKPVDTAKFKSSINLWFVTRKSTPQLVNRG